MQVVPFILRRLALGIFVLLGVLVVTFILSHSLPGNPVNALLGKQATQLPQLAAKLSSQYHYNDPLYVQFYYYLVNLLQGNLGYSTSRGMEPVSYVIAQTLPFSLQIAFFAFFFSIIFGIILGVVSARYAHRPVDHLVRAVYLTGVSSPSFFIAIIFLIVFTFSFRILPGGGAVDQGIVAPTVITHLPMLDSLLEGKYSYFFSALRHVILPSLALAIGAFGVVVRILRTSLLEILQANYIRTARAKGLDERTVFFKHALRNGMIPVVTLSSLIVYSMIVGTLFVENIFSYPGLGQFVVGALAGQDYAGILATALIFAIVIILANLAADVLYVVVDPQIRLG
ncbi:MAG: ABC transporter permease [Nitrososphaerales archaeon]